MGMATYEQYASICIKVSLCVSFSFDITVHTFIASKSDEIWLISIDLYIFQHSNSIRGVHTNAMTIPIQSKMFSLPSSQRFHQFEFQSSASHHHQLCCYFSYTCIYFLLAAAAAFFLFLSRCILFYSPTTRFIRIICSSSIF